MNLVKESVNNTLFKSQKPSINLELLKFFKKYGSPCHGLVETFSFEVRKRPFAIRFNDVFYYVRRAGIDRIINEERMKNIIENEHLDLLGVSSHSLLLKKETLIVICPEIEDTRSGWDKVIFSLDETIQIIKLIKHTGYCDFKGYNIIREKLSQKLIFIDLEDTSFLYSRNTRNLETSLILELFKDYVTGKSPFYSLDADALEYLEEECRQHANSSERVLVTPFNTAFDAAINFELIKSLNQELLSKKALDYFEDSAYGGEFSHHCLIM
ncbi:MAG: hypothetical protein P1U36_01710 [Legionellaceae bacterium]|nr:hypothetical protein [Legionellaceae bacterium]